MKNTPPTGGPPNPPQDATAGTDTMGDASAEVSTDARIEVSTDNVSTDVSMDASADASADLSAEGSADTRDAADAGDRSIDDVSIDDVNRETGDGATLDATSPDQFTSSDAPDADGKPRAPTCTIDQPCVNGDCVGSSCDETWECFSHLAPHPCPFETIPYCGCDGKTYFFPITCSEVPYEHAGACGDGVNCDPKDIRCNQPEPDCGPGKVASVVGTCYGPCVAITECRCVFAFECPKRELYSCTPDLRCDFQMK